MKLSGAFIAGLMIVSAPGIALAEGNSVADGKNSLKADTTRASTGSTGASGSKGVAIAAPKKKLTFKEQRELESLPRKIEALESEHAQLQASMASPEFYKEGADAIARTIARAAEVEQEQLTVYERWDDLESRR